MIKTILPTFFVPFSGKDCKNRPSTADPKAKNKIITKKLNPNTTSRIKVKRKAATKPVRE